MLFQPGDLAACYGVDWTSQLIRWSTGSLLAPPGLRLGPSHVAILYRDQHEMRWAESTTLCDSPCLVRGARVAGAQSHRPEDRIEDYVSAGGRVEIYRLSPLHSLTPDESRLLTNVLLQHVIEQGRLYDLSGALLSGTRAFVFTRLFPAADLDLLFCSELVAAVLMRLNRLNHANPARYNPARLLRVLVRTGKYEHIHTFSGQSSFVSEAFQG